MPTCYTEIIEKEIDFKDFVLRCARNFSPLITMREKSLDTPIPEQLKPSQYYLNKLLGLKKELEWIESLSDKELEEKALEEYNERIRDKNNNIDKNNKLRNKYNNMLNKVKKWTPPTPKHRGLKDFMISQIVESINNDCNNHYWLNINITLKTGKDWKFMKIKEFIENISYYESENSREIEKTKNNNIWLKQLRDSL
jgi:hypothetical protein